MSGPEVDATILSLLRGPGPCPICQAEAMPPCVHRKRAHWAVQGDSGPECGDCGETIDLRTVHGCSFHEPHEVEAQRERTSTWGDDRERLGREIAERNIAAWLRHLATGRGVSATKAHTYRDLAERIERREQDS